MTWRAPSELECFLLREASPHARRLARCLALAPRIEPLMLRNARLRFLPGDGAELESELWFSPLVAARSSREIVLHLGIACVLAGGLVGARRCSDVYPGTPPDLERPEAPDTPSPTLDAVWAFTREHTRHWSAEDRLERDLRYHALRGDDTALSDGLQTLLAEIAQEQDQTRRIGLSRLAKRCLFTVGARLGNRSGGQARLLARYAALALQDAGAWSDAAGPPDALPRWLSARLPPPLSRAELGVEVRGEAEDLVLHLVAPAPGASLIELPSPLPARLHVRPDGSDGAWHLVTRGTCIPLTPPRPLVELTTLAGKRWLLRTELQRGDTGRDATQDQPPLLLVHAVADEDQARAIADWLAAHGVPVDLAAESAPSGAGHPTGQTRAVRLWTRAARALWADAQAQSGTADDTLLLRTDDAEPTGSVGGARLLDWSDWQRLAESPRAAELLKALERWWHEGVFEPPPAAGEPPTDTPSEEVGTDDRIGALLAELNDPATTPPRRLEIGDLLAELEDPRPGVGTIELEVPVEEPVTGQDTPTAKGETRTVHLASGYAPEVQALIDEIENPETRPPRRLEIGDALDKLGDPRPGVGIRSDGLPDIDWVEILAGPFIYQNGERRDLPTFWIARYPVTNAQYQAFADDGGYAEPRWWQDLKRPEPGASRWPQPNRPRTDIDWYDSVAFGRWLNARLGLPEGSVRLPTELEWEKTARGETGLAYPWGNKYRSGFANVDETYGEKKGPWYLEQTTAVGVYPHGRSPYGVEDLAGTVWEWCLNKYDDLDAIAPDTSAASRALRGGSWLYLPGSARAVSRLWSPPGLRLVFGGFRLLSSVPIEPVR